MKQQEIRKIFQLFIYFAVCLCIGVSYAEPSAAQKTEAAETQEENQAPSQKPEDTVQKKDSKAAPKEASPDQETKPSEESAAQNQNKAHYQTVWETKTDKPQSSKPQGKLEKSETQKQQAQKAPSQNQKKPSTNSLEEKAQKIEIIKGNASQPSAPPYTATDFSTTPGEPIPYYNPVRSESAEEVSVLPTSQLKKPYRKHRFSLSGDAAPWESSSQRIKNTFEFYVSADYGYVFNAFEIGPFASVSNLNRKDIDYSFIKDINFDIGLFAGLHLGKDALNRKYAPVVELKVGYRRAQNRGGILTQLGAGLQYFLSSQTVVYLTVSPYYVYKLSGGGKYGDFGINTPFGMRFYFLKN